MSELPPEQSSFSLDGIIALLAVMRRLRDPENGCPWDLDQDHKSLARYTLEEAYEVVEAIENDDFSHVCEELGDLLLQIVFHAQMASEKNIFNFNEIASREAKKMIERHPHVFGAREASTAQDVLKNWEADKAKKRAAQAEAEKRPVSVLDGVNVALPAISRALKLQQRAARVGFDWDKPEDVFAKLREETGEMEMEIKAGRADAMEDELGDMFFALVNLARLLKIDPERALRRTNQKFERRFHFIEKELAAQGSDPHQATLDEMESLWKEAKAQERSAL